VSKTDQITPKTRAAAGLILAGNINLKYLTFVPYDVPINGKDIQSSHSGAKAQVYNTSIKYVQSIMFGSLLSGPRIMPIGNINLVKNAARARMVKSPDEEYYYKAYPEAPNF
jgi:hypothetical protein